MSVSSVNWSELIDIAQASDIGMRRSANQDSLLVAYASNFEHWQQRGHLMIVADGMGAHAAGELASRLAVEHVSHLYHKFPELSAPESLRRSMLEANAEINRRGQANEEFHNMGTTCSSLVLLPQGAVVAHIGDSRVYRLRHNRLEQLTFDHSLVWEMRAAGQLSDLEGSLAIPKNVITRSLGPYPDVKVDLEGPFPIDLGDVFLICSDGLTGQVQDSEIGLILAHFPPQQAARVLIDLANLRGGPDNTSVIIAKILDPRLASQQSKPLTIGAKPRRPGGLAVLWATLLASLVLAVLLGWITDSLLSAVVPGVIAFGSLLLLAARSLGMGSGTVVAPGKRFGKGPYARVDCALGQKLLDQLQEVMAQLMEAGEHEHWNFDRRELAVRVDRRGRRLPHGMKPRPSDSSAWRSVS